MGKYYITTTAPYVNSDPHIGFALEIIQADVIARYHEIIGDAVFFNTGTDEHGKKIYEKAVEEGKDPKDYVDYFAAKFKNLKKILGLSDGLNFSRTTDEKHIAAAQEIWRRVEANGYIRRGVYLAKYCVGCELEKQDSDLVEGRCPLHPNKELEQIDEENYFFCFSKLQEKLLSLYEKYPDFVVPAHRQKEITNFVKSGLSDFSISRLKEKMPWGIPVPGDEKQVMYVWFDALTYYISALGWPTDEDSFNSYWGSADSPRAIQVAGKDNLRQQASMWQAMLLAADLPTSRQIMIHGFITSNGMKISKSLGNTVDPLEYVEKYGVDALRYYLLAKMDPFEDSDFTVEKFEEVYKADLQKGIGNTASRIASLSVGMNLEFKKLISVYRIDDLEQLELDPIRNNIKNYNFARAMTEIWGLVSTLNVNISDQKAWELPVESKQRAEMVANYIELLSRVCAGIGPFMPETANKILTHFNQEKITKMTPLFPPLT